MKNEIKYAIGLIALGMGLVTYAQSNFVTKDLMQMVIDRLDRIETKIDNLIP